MLPLLTKEIQKPRLPTAYNSPDVHITLCRQRFSKAHIKNIHYGRRDTERTDGWAMNGRMDEGATNEQTNQRTDRPTGENERTDERTGERMDGLKDGWTNDG
jgi:hypothetical protein